MKTYFPFSILIQFTFIHPLTVRSSSLLDFRISFRNYEFFFIFRGKPLLEDQPTSTRERSTEESFWWDYEA
jgi:hypothetical protein